MSSATLRTVGGSVMVAIPKSLLESLGLTPNQKVDLSVADGRLIIEPRAKPRYALADLIAQCDPDAGIADEEQAWRDDEPVGREML